MNKDITSNYPLVTIGITCFNAEGTIEKAVLSALNQDWQNIEILICDDQSHDKSMTILKELSRQNPSLKIFQTESNGGPAKARNEILIHAKGEYIAFFDDDDVSDYRRIRYQVLKIKNYLKKNHKTTIVMCYSSGIRKYDSGYEMIINAVGSKGLIPIGNDIVDYLLLNIKRKGVFYGAGTPSCSLMMRTSDLLSLKGFDEDFRRVEDADLAIRAGYKNAHFIGCSESLYIQNSTTGSDKTPKINFESEILLIKKHSKFLEKKGMYSYAINWTKLRYSYFIRDIFGCLKFLLFVLLKNPIIGGIHFYNSSIKRIIHEKKIKKGAKIDFL
jgi:glycosyltransferase involved in cell wall biosynthesis